MSVCIESGMAALRAAAKVPRDAKNGREGRGCRGHRGAFFPHRRGRAPAPEARIGLSRPARTLRRRSHEPRATMAFTVTRTISPTRRRNSEFRSGFSKDQMSRRFSGGDRYRCAADVAGGRTQAIRTAKNRRRTSGFPARPSPEAPGPPRLPPDASPLSHATPGKAPRGCAG